MCSPRSSGGSAELTACNTGLARGLFNVCHAHAKERIQGGKPIIEHPTVQLMLSEMLMNIEVAEQFMWRICWGVEADETYNPRFTRHGKVFSDKMGLKSIELATDILGGSGIMRDFPAEKIIRDILIHLPARRRDRLPHPPAHRPDARRPRIRRILRAARACREGRGAFQETGTKIRGWGVQSFREKMEAASSPGFLSPSALVTFSWAIAWERGAVRKSFTPAWTAAMISSFVGPST